MKYVVVGGTGTLGSALIKKILCDPLSQVVCLSRDELKQKNLRQEINSPRLTSYIADVRDKSSLGIHFEGAGTVFHVAALKHIDCVENNIKEAVKTNIEGSFNVAEAAMENFVPWVVFSSTDKAVEPVNAYGMTKGISERYFFSLNEIQCSTRFSVFRWGNIVGSRGSVVHQFIKSLREQKKVYLTDLLMSRFWYHIDDAVSFLLSTYRNASKTEISYPLMKSSKVFDLALATANVLGIKDFETDIIGMGKGEKLFETIYQDVNSENCEKYSIAELEKLVAEFIT